MEAAEGGVKFIVAITEGVPAHDEAWFFNKLKRDFPDVQLLGPNCPGIISPGKCNIGITAGHIAKAPVEGKPNVGIVSRSGTLTYQALYELKLNDIGVTTCVGIGGDPVPGTSFIDCLEALRGRPRHQGRDDDRRDRRLRRGGGRRLHRRQDDQAGRLLHRRRHRARPARRWATPAPSCRAARAPRPPSRRRSQAAGVQVGQNPTEAGTLMVEVVKASCSAAASPAAAAWSRGRYVAPRRAVALLAGRRGVLVVGDDDAAAHHAATVVDHVDHRRRRRRPPADHDHHRAADRRGRRCRPGRPEAVVTPNGVVLAVLARQRRRHASWPRRRAATRSPSPGTPLTGANVVLDPGHGGDEPGAVGPAGTTEKAVNLAVAQETKRRLEALGATVVLTRTADYRITLAQPGRHRHGLHPLLFVSIHHNAEPDGPRDGPGSETYFQIGVAGVEAGRRARVRGGGRRASRRTTSRGWPTPTPAPSTGPRSDGGDYYGILRRTAGVPAVLSEAAFISQPARGGAARRPGVPGGRGRGPRRRHRPLRHDRPTPAPASSSPTRGPSPPAPAAAPPAASTPPSADVARPPRTCG